MFKPPGELNIKDGNISENFMKWKWQIEVYLAASGASAKEKEVQVAIVLHCAGLKVIEVFDKFTWHRIRESENDVKTPRKVCLKLHPRNNKVLESYIGRSVQFEGTQRFEPYLTEKKPGKKNVILW